MTLLAAVRAGLAANLANLPVAQVSAYILASPTLPVVWVRPAPSAGFDYHHTMRNGLEVWTMLVQAYVGTTTDIGAQKKLDELLATSGGSSVKTAIESDKTLGGAALDLIVERCSGYQEYGRPDGSSVLGAEWTVQVQINGS
jgi:hypothetical protein